MSKRSTAVTYDAITVDLRLGMHLGDLEFRRDDLKAEIKGETSLRLRTIAESKLAENEKHLVQFRRLIRDIRLMQAGDQS